MRKVGQAIIHPILYEDKQQWLQFRSNGIGGSEMAAILGLDDYSHPAKIFHQKIGLLQFPDFDNEPMFWGRYNEESIADVWQYWWDGEYLKNYKEKKKIRSCRKVNGYAINPDYPHLFGSLDRYIPKGSMCIDGTVLDTGGVLEVKTISEYESGKWTHDIPEKYVVQVHTYMLVFGFRYAEIVYLMGGNKLRVVPIHWNQELADIIVYNSYKFWFERVVPAQELVEKYHHHYSRNEKDKAEEYLRSIDDLEPFPSKGKSYREIMNQKYDKDFYHDYTPATDEVFEYAKKHKLIKEIMKSLTEEMLEVENHLVSAHDKSKSEYVRFGAEGGYSRFYLKKNGINPTFDNKIKVNVKKDEVTNLLKEMINEKSEDLLGDMG